MVESTALTELCHVVNTAEEFRERISMLYHQKFTAEEKEFRKNILHQHFSNEASAKQMVKSLS
jgi:hypothetical protein